jgi:hypothetical protein
MFVGGNMKKKSSPGRKKIFFLYEIVTRDYRHFFFKDVAAIA